MKKDSNSSFAYIPTSRPISRSATPNDLNPKSKPITPYPLYKQKIGALLKPPDYSRNPPKFMSIREPRSEFEKKEASTQVKLLKKTFNRMYQRFGSVDRALNILKSESIKINALRVVGESDLEHLKSKISSLEEEEEAMLSKIRDEFQNNTIYKHVRERMRQTLMHLEVKNQYLSDQIRLRDFLTESEHRKKIKTLENKFTKVQAFKQLKKTVGLDVKDRNMDILLLEEDIAAREKIHELRNVRIKKYEEIAETAANEEREGKNNNMRENVLVHVFWAKYLDFRYTQLKKKFSHVELAFSKIKSETLIGNIEEVVTRFLLKEDRLMELMLMLGQSKDTCLKYLRQNDEMEAKIDSLLLTQRPGVDTNIPGLREKLYFNFLKCSQAKQDLLRLKTCKEKVKVWLIKELSKFEYKPSQRDTLKTLLKQLSLCVKSQTQKSSSFITEV